MTRSLAIPSVKAVAGLIADVVGKPVGHGAFERSARLGDLGVDDVAFAEIVARSCRRWPSRNTRSGPTSAT